ncbi:MAG: hypothetical protein QXV83_03060 [Candidatus Anstonellaceae archaeon]
MIPKNRSNSIRKLKRKTPSNRTTILFKKRTKQKKFSCALTNKKLAGTSFSKSLAKSKKVPNRPYAGQLIAKEARRLIKYKELLRSNQITLEQIPSKYHKFLNLPANPS